MKLITLGKQRAPYRCFLKLFLTYSREERLLRLGRLVWARGKPGYRGYPGGEPYLEGYSAKLSLGLTPRLFCFKRGWHEWFLVVLGVRLHYLRSHGGWLQ